MLTQRPVQADDLAIICQFPQTAEELFFFYPSAEYPLTVEQLTLAIEQRTHPTVIVKDREIAGFANFYQWQAGGCCKIGNVIINPKLRGQGIAKFLIKAMIRKAREHYQANQVEVACFNDNTAALLLYKQLGFTPVDIEQRENKQGKKVALIHLSYELIYVL
ncbi:GNAT family N-acetyltransferase [Entomomonas asaccharolytica]|uniref:GNAT family N-acetyltransferase n=1 Tax=Entomomonas asaccharolytica TaxID=2785331 RepID=A0A974NE34_9GAMM|nr:GNAT family N-acetyltransferase [Entomomonas asaccharolytica]QQP84848.1 GNAT family N-acetyltransferase [Entomomonas asaccharolytica]